MTPSLLGPSLTMRHWHWHPDTRTVVTQSRAGVDNWATGGTNTNTTLCKYNNAKINGQMANAVKKK